MIPPASPIYAFTALCIAWRAKSCADVWHVCRSLPGGRRGVSVAAVRLPGDAAAQEHSAAPARVRGFRRAGEWGGSRVTCRPALNPSFRACLRVARADPSWAHTHVRSPAVLLRPAQARREFWSWIL